MCTKYPLKPYCVNMSKKNLFIPSFRLVLETLVLRARRWVKSFMAGSERYVITNKKINKIDLN
jgi:hypothetical protein